MSNRSSASNSISGREGREHRNLWEQIHNYLHAT